MTCQALDGISTPRPVTVTARERRIVPGFFFFRFFKGVV
jgi:hypothetical protein